MRNRAWLWGEDFFFYVILEERGSFYGIGTRCSSCAGMIFFTTSWQNTKKCGGYLIMLVAVCDDEKKIGKLIKRKIQRYCFEQNIEWKIMLFESGDEVLEYDFDQINVLFLDVDMPGRSGMEVAKKIREKNKTMLIIFLTAYSEFVFESFKVETFRYLIKPLND